MLALVERGGGEEIVEILRSLSEVSARSGRCRDALDFAARAIAIAQELGLSPGRFSTPANRPGTPAPPATPSGDPRVGAG
jgi:hypothetical protein